MDISLVTNSNYNWVSRINEIHLYLFILTIVIILLASLFVYLNSKINALENKIQNIDYLLDFHKSNIDVLFSENIQQKIKTGTRIRELTKYTNEMINQLLDSSDIHKNNYKQLLELQNEHTAIIEKMSKINLKTDQLYKMIINAISILNNKGAVYYYLLTQELDLETTDFPLDYLPKDSMRQIIKKYNNLDPNIIPNYEFACKHLPDVIKNMRDNLYPNEKNDEEIELQITNWPYMTTE